MLLLAYGKYVHSDWEQWKYKTKLEEKKIADQECNWRIILDNCFCFCFLQNQWVSNLIPLSNCRIYLKMKSAMRRSRREDPFTVDIDFNEWIFFKFFLVFPIIIMYRMWRIDILIKFMTTEFWFYFRSIYFISDGAICCTCLKSLSLMKKSTYFECVRMECSSERSLYGQPYGELDWKCTHCICIYNAMRER